MRRADSFEKTLMIGKERLREGGEGDDRGWDGWMASPTQWTWVWVNSGSWWWEAWRAAVHGVTVRHDWATELNWTELPHISLSILLCLSSGERWICMDSTSGFPCPPTSGWVWSVGAWRETGVFRSGFLAIYFQAEKTLSTEFSWLGFPIWKELWCNAKGFFPETFKAEFKALAPDLVLWYRFSSIWSLLFPLKD